MKACISLGICTLLLRALFFIFMKDILNKVLMASQNFFLNIFGLEKEHLNCRLTIHMNYASQRI
ncbi:TPA: hypothetical protein KQB60_001244 [Clostridioides difficile]|nr:hypothetical protein [Clostridioides difficile]